jgi:hypothetical protein
MPAHSLAIRAQWRRSFQIGRCLSPHFRFRRWDGSGCGDDGYDSGGALGFRGISESDEQERGNGRHGFACHGVSPF